MVIDSAFVCDRAAMAGKVSALGVGSVSIHSTRLPVRRHRLCVEARVGAHETGAGRKRVRIDVIDADDGDFVGIKAETGFPHPAGNLETAQTLAPGFDDLHVGHFCPPSVYVLLGGIEMRPMGFDLRELPERD